MEANAPTAGALTMVDTRINDFSAWLKRRQIRALNLSIEEIL
jgi:hypothetical protein